MDQKKKKLPIIAGSMLLVVGGGIAFSALNQNNNENTEQKNIAKDCIPVGSEDENHDSSNFSNFNNGTYESEGSYNSPAGTECVDVKLTITDNMVSDVVITPRATNVTSQSYQRRFRDGIKGQIVGKKINEIDQLGSINGSSLTPNGFLQALEKIKEEAGNV